MRSRTFKNSLKDDFLDSGFYPDFNSLENDLSIADEVMELRKKRNMTQKQLANLAGSTQLVIAKLESGNYDNISLTLLKRLALVLGAQAVIHINDISA